MKPLPESPKSSEADPILSENGNHDRHLVLQQLELILSSPSFRSAYRCSEFLRYVVTSKLDGHTERLKERVIGTELFKRPPGYATGEDPVVRVQAGEVRRRLDQFYQAVTQPPQLRIELPVGSYCPVFLAGQPSPPREAAGAAAAPAATVVRRWKPGLKVISLLAGAVFTAFAATALFSSLHRPSDANNVLQQFWAPAFASHQPMLICIANAANPSLQEISSSNSSAHSRLVESEAPALSTDPSRDGDPEIVPAADASVAFALSGLFGKLDKPIQLRIGEASTYEDLRDSPAAVIGGFNNKWTMQLVSNLHFAFVRDNDQYAIREQIPNGRVWTTRLGGHAETLEDFAIVGRLIDSKTGQFTVAVAGIGPRGTQAAGEFVSSPRYLEKGLAGAPADWEHHNLEVLLQTTVTDVVAGPPHVIATYSW